MANPTPVIYSSPVTKVGGGREIFPNASLDLIAAAPENSWVKLNANLYSDAWPPIGLRTLSTPRNMLRAWSSFAWDVKRNGLWLWGGGHANYSGNEVYFWSARTREWSLAFHTARVLSYTTGPNVGTIYKSSDDRHSPLSAHTYDNNIYLPIIDRFLTFGGAGQGLARPFELFDGETYIRDIACYTLQPDLAGQGFLGGLAGQNYQGAGYETAALPGARAWEMRDWHGQYPTVATSHINGGAVYREEGGKDVVYYLAGSSTSRGVYRAVLNQDWRDDTFERVCSAGNDAGGGQGAIALDTARSVILYPLRGSQANLMQFCDLKTAGLSNQWKWITAFDGDPADVAEMIAGFTSRQGVDYDPIRDHFVIWEKGPNVWAIKPPEGNPTPATGWTVTKLTAVTTPAPPDIWEESQSGTHGKWQYAPDLDAFVGVIRPTQGEVWAYRPTSWQDPRI